MALIAKEHDFGALLKLGSGEMKSGGHRRSSTLADAVEAVIVNQKISTLLQIEQNQPCLKISRRTFSAKGIVSYAQLYHPGNRYRIGGHLDF